MKQQEVEDQNEIEDGEQQQQIDEEKKQVEPRQKMSRRRRRCALKLTEVFLEGGRYGGKTILFFR